MQPLADKLRPTTLDDIIGQSHIIGEGKVLNKIIENGCKNNLVLYGPPGTGKTSVASILASRSNRKHIKLNAISCGVKDIKEAIESSKRDLFYDGVLLQLEEFHVLNKKQQQSLLESLEDGRVTLIATTTENPYFSIFKAILSRSLIVEFKQISSKDILNGLTRAVDKLKAIHPNMNIIVDEKALEAISNSSGGDMRHALNVLSVLFEFGTNKKDNSVELSLSNLELCHITNNFHFDTGDMQYSLLSAYHKSVRGGDIDASLHYLSKLISCGNSSGNSYDNKYCLLSIARRILSIASEDIGISCSQGIVVAQACVSSALQLGLPEGRLPLAHATIYLCLLPKSSSVLQAIDSAIYDVENIDTGEIPLHLKDAHYSGAKNLGRGVDYKYPHDYENNYVEQQYLPDAIKDRVYYVPGNNKNEQLFKQYWDAIKNQK